MPTTFGAILPPCVLEGQVGDGRARDAEHVTDGCVALAEDIVKPIRPRPSHVAGDLPDRQLGGGSPKCQLVLVEIADGRQEKPLMMRPTCVERLKDLRPE
jgi:hypothetical protein